MPKVAPDDGYAAEQLVMMPPKTPFDPQRAAGVSAQRLTLADGRTLEYYTDGDPSKPAVFLIHGQWQTGKFWIGSDWSDALYLVMPTRPNYGGSSKHSGGGYVSLADDLKSLADHLKIDKFHVLGGSSGGPCAIAVKALLKERVGRCIVISGDTENATLAGGGSQAELACCAPNKACGCCLPCCFSCCMLPMLSASMDGEKMWKNIEQGKAESLGATAAEGEAWPQLGKAKMLWNVAVSKAVFKAGATGGVADYVNESKRWAWAATAALDALDDVELWHGESDSTVPFAAALHNKGKMPKASVHKMAGMGHDLGALMLDQRLADLAAGPAPTAMKR